MDIPILERTETFFDNVAPVRARYLTTEECVEIDKHLESINKREHDVFFMKIDTTDHVEAQIIFDAINDANGKLLEEDTNYPMDSVSGPNKNQRFSYFNVTLVKDQKYFPNSTVLLSVPNTSVKVTSDEVERRLVQLVEEANRTLFVPKLKDIGRQIVLPANVSRSN